MEKILTICKFFIIILIMIIPVTKVKSNQPNFGLKIGLSIPQLSGGTTEISQGYNSRLATNFGLTLSTNIYEIFEMQIEFLYASQGGKKNGYQIIPPTYIQGITFPQDIKFYADFNNEAILNYLEFPVLLKYKLVLDNQSAFYIVGGPYIGYLLNAKAITSGSGLIYTDKNKTPFKLADGSILPVQNFTNQVNITSSINPWIFGITGGIGYLLPFWSGELIFDLRASYSLTNIQKDLIYGKNYTGNLVFTIGYNVNI